ncbi:MAG: hypothetical protein FKY71_19310 [Spiribacter salinus]|uniref:DUF968 domain-containing protein n=1 Tax=Spiribacter salinus TaxID=1335746 RepID=A0A540V7N4_9GAMM|nr:MAG: hypothetical protein FKY71_19310 [Spiribacter salinus]
MDRIAQMPCAIGQALGEDHGPVEVHHIRQGQGMSQRASHWLTVPLCPACHRGRLGVHGDRTLLRMARLGELDLLALTIEEVVRG